MNNYALESGGAIFFRKLIPNTFDKNLNIFTNNKAKYYGDVFAGYPSRLGMIAYSENNTNEKLWNLKDVQNFNFQNVSIQNDKIQSGIYFNLKFIVVLMDQFYQKAFSSKKS